MTVKIDESVIRNYLVELNPRLENEDINSGVDLFQIGAVDSYTIVQLIGLFEERFNIVFDYSDLTGYNFRTITDILDLLFRRYLHA